MTRWSMYQKLIKGSTSCSVCDLGCGDAGPASDLLLQLRHLGVPIHRYRQHRTRPGPARARGAGIHPRHPRPRPAPHPPPLTTAATPTVTPHLPTSDPVAGPVIAAASGSDNIPVAPAHGTAAVVGGVASAALSPQPAAESATDDVSRGLERTACDTPSGGTQPGTTRSERSPAVPDDGPSTTATAAVPPAAATYELTEADMSGYLQGCAAASVDVLLSSFAVHHLSLAEKARLVAGAARVLRPGGCFLLIDIFLAEGQTREMYMEAYLADVDANWTSLSHDEREDIKRHVAGFDHPARVSDYESWCGKSRLPADDAATGGALRETTLGAPQLLFASKFGRCIAMAALSS
ncbi:MAG: hypothetical protein WDW36_004504 [Sanguina aurantia]